MQCNRYDKEADNIRFADRVMLGAVLVIIFVLSVIGGIIALEPWNIIVAVALSLMAGSVLPDIDISRATRVIVVTTIGAIAPFLLLNETSTVIVSHTLALAAGTMAGCWMLSTLDDISSHRGSSHSIPFILTTSAIMWAWAGGAVALALLVGQTLHIILDWIFAGSETRRISSAGRLWLGGFNGALAAAFCAVAASLFMWTANAAETYMQQPEAPIVIIADPEDVEDTTCDVPTGITVESGEAFVCMGMELFNSLTGDGEDDPTTVDPKIGG